MIDWPTALVSAAISSGIIIGFRVWWDSRRKPRRERLLSPKPLPPSRGVDSFDVPPPIPYRPRSGAGVPPVEDYDG